MLYYLFRFLEQFGIPGSAIWGYISFRALLALMWSLSVPAIRQWTWLVRQSAYVGSVPYVLNAYDVVVTSRMNENTIEGTKKETDPEM